MERNAQHAFDAEEVMAYLDGALAAHLVSCSECQEVAQGFRALSERMLSFEVEHPSAGLNETVLAALDSGKPAKAPAAGRAQDQRAWSWRSILARPRNWAIACAVTVAAIALAAIPILRREQSISLNGRNFTDLSKLERKQDAASDGYKRWLSNDDNGSAAPASPTPPPTGKNVLGLRNGSAAGISFDGQATGEELKAPETIG